MMSFRFSRETILLFGILVLACAVRLWGVNFGLPYLYHADEPIVVNHALAYGAGDLNPHFFKIPPLVSYLLFLSYGLYFAIGRGVGLFHSARDLEQLFYIDPSSFYLIARLVFGVLLGTASVYLLYRLAKRFRSSETALWASFFLAVNFLHVRDSHYIYADIPLVFVLLLGMGVILKLASLVIPESSYLPGSEGRSSPGFPPTLKGCFVEACGNDKKSNPLTLTRAWKWHLLAGFMIGLATAVKYNGVFLAIPYLWICFRNIPWKKWPLCWALAGIGALATFFALNPFAILDHAFFIKEIAVQSAANSGGFSWSHHLTYSLAGALGWPMLILAIFGTLRALGDRRSLRSQTVSVFIVAYYAVLCRFGQPYDRYVLPLIPFMMILATELLLRLKAWSRMIFWVLIPFLALPSLLKIVHWDSLMSKPDVRTVAKKWVETNVPAGSRLALDGTFYMPRLDFTPRQLEEKRRRAREGFQSGIKTRRIEALLKKSGGPSYELNFLSTAPEGPAFLFGEPLMPYDMNALKLQGIEFVFLIEALRPAGDLFFRELQNNADRVMMFSPYRDPSDLTVHDPFTMTGGPFLWSDILPRERGGYPVSIYRMRS